MKLILLTIALAACGSPQPEMTSVDGERCFPAIGTFWFEAWPRDGISAYDVAWDGEWEFARRRSFGDACGYVYQADAWPDPEQPFPTHFMCIRGRALVMHEDGP